MNKLLKLRGALPFLAAVFLNSFVDLGHKIIIQNTIFKVYDGQQQVILTAIVNGLILLPVLLLFGVVGFTADRHPKTRVMRATAWVAVGLTLAITACYALGWFWVAFAMTFLLAVQSAFYYPAKYGYIKAFFGKQNLAEANGMVQAVSIIAILAGTLVFSVLFEYWFPGEAADKGQIIRALMPIGFLLVMNALLEVVMVYRLPQVDSGSEGEPLRWQQCFSSELFRQTLRPVLSREAIWLSMIGLAMFWSIGQVMLAAFPAFAKAQLGETNTVVIQAIIAASGLGIALGSGLASRLSRSYIETGLIPVGAAGIALGLGALPNLGSAVQMGLDFFFIGMMGGMFIVPLNALVQFYARDRELGKVLAGSNLIQNTGMMSFLVLTVVFALAGISSRQLLLLIALVAVCGGAYTVLKLPQSLVRFIFAFVMTSHYRVKVQGMQNIPEQGGVLLLGNHISWIDWAILQIACPRPVQFVMLKSIYQRWYLKWFFKLFGCIPIESGPSSKGALESVTELLNRGRVVCLFPEGAISRNGHLGEFRRGYERAAQAADEGVVIQPFYLHGLWGSQFSRSSERLKRAGSRSRDLIVAFGETLHRNTPAEVLKRRVFDLSITSWHHYVEGLPSLPEAWIDTAKSRGGELSLVDTESKQTLSASQLLSAAIAFARRIAYLSPERNIGLLLPTGAAGVITNMAVLLRGKTIVNLDYTAEPAAFASAVAQADIRTLYTSRQFLEKLKARGVDFSDTLVDLDVIYLEELRATITKPESALTLLAVKSLPAGLLKLFYCRARSAQETAAILFSSGSEGKPKGIQLSHRNIMANLKQIAQVLNAEDEDVVLASLPSFHAFGLTVTQLMPLVEGMPIVCHPDPTDVLGAAQAIAKHRATLLCGTSSLLRLYCRDNKIHPLMLDSLRLVVAGAEKLNSDVREAFKLKFNKDILEGYGVTETTPVASINLPDRMDLEYLQVQQGNKPGTVGMPLPGASFKIVDPGTLAELPAGEAGMILIGGVQVMQGYLKEPNKTAEVIAKIDDTRWYVTGDKGYLDDDGFLTIST